MTATAEIYETDRQDEGGPEGGSTTEWRWRVRAGNGEIVASGEGYTTKGDALRGYSNARNAMINAVLDSSPWDEKSQEKKEATLEEEPESEGKSRRKKS